MTARDIDILSIISNAGPSGITLDAVARHLVNMHTTLFEQPDFQVAHRLVQRMLKQMEAEEPPVVAKQSTGRFLLTERGRLLLRQYIRDLFAEEGAEATAYGI